MVKENQQVEESALVNKELGNGKTLQCLLQTDWNQKLSTPILRVQLKLRSSSPACNHNRSCRCIKIPANNDNRTRPKRSQTHTLLIHYDQTEQQKLIIFKKVSSFCKQHFLLWFVDSASAHTASSRLHLTIPFLGNFLNEKTTTTGNKVLFFPSISSWWDMSLSLPIEEYAKGLYLFFFQSLLNGICLWNIRSSSPLWFCCADYF